MEDLEMKDFLDNYQESPFVSVEPKASLLRKIKASQSKDKRIGSGFLEIDKKIKGFRNGGTYLVAGLEKSGKSSFLLNIVASLISRKIKVGIINTELSDLQFFQKLVALGKDLVIEQVEQNSELVEKWINENNHLFEYAGIDEITSSSTIDFDKTMNIASDFVRKKIKVLIYDNLTVFRSQTQSQNGWQEIERNATNLINFTKRENIISFIVIHTNRNTSYTDTPTAVRKILEENEPQKIFDDSVAVVRRPTLADTYGGGGYQLQLSGSILIWRPFQKFQNQELSQLSAVLLDSFRDAPSGGRIQMRFIGEKGRFVELETEDIIEEIFGKREVAK